MRHTLTCHPDGRLRIRRQEKGSGVSCAQHPSVRTGRRHPIPFPRIMRLHLSLLLSGSLILCARGWAESSVRVLPKPATDSKNDFYVGNRPPLQAAPLIKLPVGSIRPEGWLRKQLQLQAEGFHGHLGEISRFLVKENNAWLDPSGSGDHGWEELPYWLKGFCNLGFVLRDEAVLRESQIWIEAALKSQKPDGWFGPDQDRSGAATGLKGRDDLWPNMIMLFCLQDYHEFTGDPRVIELMTRYFRYLNQRQADQLLHGYWPRMRGGDLLMSVYWLYNRTGEPWLLDLAHKVHQSTADWTSDVINWHNVNMSQGFGRTDDLLPAVRSAGTFEASYRNYDKIRRMYGQVPGGMFGGDENCRPGFTDPRQAVETCGMVEMMLSTETLTWITGDLLWADRCEDVAFNSLPAALTADSEGAALPDGAQPGALGSQKQESRIAERRAHAAHEPARPPLLPAQLGPRLAVLCGTPVVCHAGQRPGGCLLQRLPGHGKGRRWHAGDDRSEYALPVRRERGVRRATRISRSPSRCTCAFPAGARLPKLPSTSSQKRSSRHPCGYIRIERRWSDGDRLQLKLPMRITLRHWSDNHDSVSVDRGPLTYSLEIGEQYVREGGTDKWPAWEIHPTTPWNYGLVLQDDPAQSFEVVQGQWPSSDMPFAPGQSPIRLRAQGQRIRAMDSGFTGTGGPAACQSGLLRTALRNHHSDPDGRGAAAHQFVSGDRQGARCPPLAGATTTQVPRHRLSLLDIRYRRRGRRRARTKEFRRCLHPAIHLVGSPWHPGMDSGRVRAVPHRRSGQRLLVRRYRTRLLPTARRLAT